MKRKKITAYFDGACEPVNPGGIASFGAVIFFDGKRIWECSRIFYPKKGEEKETSNNVAEYSGFLAILEYLIENKLNHEDIHIYGDSKLVINQMFGLWKMHGGFYMETAIKAQSSLMNFTHITGSWIPREKNGIADELSKAELLKANIRFKIQPT